MSALNALLYVAYMANTEVTKYTTGYGVEWVELIPDRHLTANREFEPFVQKRLSESTIHINKTWRELSDKHQIHLGENCVTKNTNWFNADKVTTKRNGSKQQTLK